jgi:hypothetical protein
MAWTKTITDCDAYWRPDLRVKANKWRSFDEELRKAAFNQAVDEIKLYLNRTVEDPPTGTTSIYRDDYAVYEQALYILENANIQKKAGQSSAVKIGRNEEQKEDDNWLSPQAVRYLYVSKLRIARG